MATVGWSIFNPAQGGGDPAAVAWAQALLTDLGAPMTTGNEQFVYDWQKSEGAGGKYNPLNQGPVPGHPELTTTGSQFGGGAADFASYQAGLQGAVDYLNMPAYKGVLAGLLAGDPAGAKAALIASPWAQSHYGYGANWNSSALPGVAPDPTLLASITGPAGAAAGAVGSAVGGAVGGAVSSAVKPVLDWFDSWAVRGFLVAAGAIAVLVGLDRTFGAEVDDAKAAGDAADRAVRETPPGRALPAKGPDRSGPARPSGRNGSAGASPGAGAPPKRGGVRADVGETVSDAGDVGEAAL